MQRSAVNLYKLSCGSKDLPVTSKMQMGNNTLHHMWPINSNQTALDTHLIRFSSLHKAVNRLDCALCRFPPNGFSPKNTQ